MSCPICAKEADAKYRPFCSRRCADVDLGKWLTGSYALPSPDEEAGAKDNDDDIQGASSANLAKPLRPV